MPRNRKFGLWLDQEALRKQLYRDRNDNEEAYAGAPVHPLLQGKLMELAECYLKARRQAEPAKDRRKRS